MNTEDFKLVACYITYNNADYLRASLEVIQPFVDEILILDGRFEHFPAEDDYSTDGTLAIAREFEKRFPNKVILIPPRLYKDEIEKRNTYLSYVQPGDWLFIIDADEIPFGQLDLLKAMLAVEEAYVVNVLEYYGSISAYKAIKRPRLVRKLTGMEYRGNHYSIYHDYQGQAKNVFVDKEYTDQRVYENIQLMHYGNYRAEAVKTRKEAYLLHLIETETRPDIVNSPDEAQFYREQGVGDSVDIGQLLVNLRLQALKEQKEEV